MLYRLDYNKIISVPSNNLDKAIDETYSFIGIFNISKATEICTSFGLSPIMIEDLLQNSSARFETREGIDIICTNLIDYNNNSSPLKKGFITILKNNYIFLQKNSLLFICENESLTLKIFEKLEKDETPDLSLGKLLYYFFDWITKFDSRYLEALEQKITSLEDEIIQNLQTRNYIKTIITLRKHLFSQKRYYEQLLDIFAYISENENCLLDKRTLRSFNTISSKSDRLYHNVLSLRDYVTQIREAYQAEVDISLNTTMKVFTVITAIFLPLTLIAGWYGMNFDMPEYKSPLGYPLVILMSIVVIYVCIMYFKKHKWF